MNKNHHSDKQATIIAISSGKGGVGKSTIATNLAIALAKNDIKICIFDADTNLANINILLGLTPLYTIEDIIDGRKSIHDIIINGPNNLKIVPAASGIASITDLSIAQQRNLIQAIEQIENEFDYIIIDTAAGTASNVINFIRSAHELILIITTEPTSLTDAFALLRVLKKNEIRVTPLILVNMALNYADSMEVYKRFEGAVKKYLNLTPRYLGYIIKDQLLPESVKHQKAIITTHPDALSSRCILTLEKIIRKQISKHHSLTFSDLWRKVASGFSENNTEFSKQADQFHITDKDIEKHISKTSLFKDINDFISSDESSMDEVLEAMDLIINTINHKLQSSTRNNIITIENHDLINKHLITNLKKVIDINNIPKTLVEGRSLLKTMNRIQSTLQGKENLLDDIIEKMEIEIKDIEKTKHSTSNPRKKKSLQ